MNRISKYMEELSPWLKAVIVTAVTMLFSKIVLYDLTSVSFFAPMEKASDFRFSDFYTLVENDSPEKILDRDIVIVPVDGCNRREMSKVFDDIDYCAPAAVGFDVFFSPPSDPENDPLALSLANCENLIMPVMVEESDTGLIESHLSYYDSVVTPSGGFAAINIEGDGESHATVREFTKGFRIADKEIPSLAVALATLGRQESIEKLKSRSGDDELISFASRKFEFVMPDEILENEDIINGRIVIVGKMKDIADMHITPLDNFTPGLLIHAYTTATITSGDYIRQFTQFENYLIGSLLCYLVVWINLRFCSNPMNPLLVRGLQLFLLYIMIVVGTTAYVHYHIDLNFSYSMMTVALGAAACEIYSGIFAEDALFDQIIILYKKIKNKIKKK